MLWMAWLLRSELMNSAYKADQARPGGCESKGPPQISTSINSPAWHLLFLSAEAISTSISYTRLRHLVIETNPQPCSPSCSLSPLWQPFPLSRLLLLLLPETAFPLATQLSPATMLPQAPLSTTGGALSPTSMASWASHILSRTAPAPTLTTATLR